MNIKVKNIITLIISMISVMIIGLCTYKVISAEYTGKTLSQSAASNGSLFWNDIAIGDIVADGEDINKAESSRYWICLNHTVVNGFGTYTEVKTILDINVNGLGKYSTQIKNEAGVTNKDYGDNKTIKKLAYLIYAATVDSSKGFVGDSGASNSKRALYYFYNNTDLQSIIGRFSLKRNNDTTFNNSTIQSYADTYANSETTGSSATITESSDSGAEVATATSSDDGKTYSYIGPFTMKTAGDITSVTIKDGSSSPAVAGYAVGVGGKVSSNIAALPKNGNKFYIATTAVLTSVNISVTINASGTAGGGTIINPVTGQKTTGYIRARIIFMGNSKGQATAIFRGDPKPGQPSSDSVTFTAKNNLGKMVIQKVGAYGGNDSYENVRDFGFKIYHLEGSTKRYLRINDTATISGQTSVSIGANTSYTADANSATTIYTSSNGTITIDNISIEYQYYIEESNTDNTNYDAEIISATVQAGTGQVTNIKIDGNIAGPITVQLKGANNTATKIMLKDYRKTGDLTIEKVDKDDYNTKLGNVEFKLKNKDTGYYVVAEKTAEGEYNIPDQLKGYTQNEANGTTFVTNSSGTIKITGLDIGNYEIIEINNPIYGYTVLPDNVSVTITNSNMTTQSVENEKQTGNLKIEKQDADDANTKMDNVSFRIKRITSDEALGSGYVVGLQGDGDNLTPMETATGTVYFDNMTVTDNPEEATTFVTDGQGLVQIYNILIGTYEIEEISVGDRYGYYVNPDFVTWEITASGGAKETVNNSTTATVEVTRQPSTQTSESAVGSGTTDTVIVKNEKQTGNIKIEKQDADDSSTKMKEISFRLKRETSDECLGSGYVVAMQGDPPSSAKPIETATGTIYLDNMTVTDNPEEATTFVTDERGLVEIYNILIGTYTVEEISVGDKYGYYVNPDYIKWEITTSGGATSTVDGSTSATIEVTRQPSTETSKNAVGSGTSDGITVKNEKQTGNLKIQKKDADNDSMKLQGVSFRIRRVTSNECLGSGYVIGMQGDAPSNATPIETATGTVYFADMKVTDNPEEATTFVTDEQGLIEIYNILIGEYVVEEISVGDHFGYDIDSEFISWEITNSDGATSTVNQSTSATVQVVRQKSPDTRPEVADQGIDNADQIVTKNTRKYIKIRGFAWEDKTDGKNSTKDYVWKDDTEDRRLANVSVKLKTANGQVLDEAITDENGEYVFGNYDEDPNAIKIEIDDLVGAYIEFEYNGMSYQSIVVNSEFDKSEEKDSNGNTLVKYSGTTNKSSDEGQRPQFNDEFSTISKGRASNGNHEIRYNYDSENHVSKVIYGDNLKYGYDGQTYPISGVYDQYAIQAVTQQSSTNALCTDLTPQAIRQNAVVEIGGLNLGVEERVMPDLFVLEDMQDVQISLNGYTHTYQYAQRFEDPENYAGGDPFNVTVRFANKYLENSYSREVYSSDVVYNQHNPGSLQIYITYIMKYTNESSIYTNLKTLSNYYDARYENIVVKDDSGNVINGCQIDNSYNPNGLKKINIPANYLIAPGETREMTITYQLNNDAVNSLLNETLTLDSVTEVASYSSYSDEGRTPYAGIDIDSAPDTVQPKNVDGKINITDTIEDDTDKAPSLILNVKEGRVIAGTVWEDSAREDLLEDTDIGYDRERKGDGIYDDANENVVQDVKVDLLTVTGSGYELAKLYKMDGSVEDASMMTTGQGDYNFTGVIPANYVLRYTYGDNNGTFSIICDKDGNPVLDDDGNVKHVEADEYKSTIYRGGNKADMDAYWYRGETSNVSGISRLSDARDTIAVKRDGTTIDNIVEYRTTQDEEYNYETVNAGLLKTVSADTAQFEIKLDYDINLDNTSGYGVELKFIFDNIDLGIIERPKQYLEIGKQVANLQIVLPNGNDLINGDPRTGNLQGVRVLDDDVYIEIDNEIIQGATLRITYEISADNTKCEIDYNDEDYYIYGTVPADKENAYRIAKIVDMYDYLPEDLVLQAEDGGNWQRIDIQAEEGQIKGIILAEKVYEAVKGHQNVVHLANQIFENMAPGTRVTDTSLIVSKQLSTSTDDLTYENDIEIVKLKGRKTEDSIPGNYDPTTNQSYDPGTDTFTEDEPDDDEVEVTITPPTGESRAYWIYGIIGISILIIIGVGVVIIRKRVLKN